MEEKTERREKARGKIYIRTELTLGNNNITACYTSNVSAGGCFIIIDDSTDFPALGEQIKLSLFLDNQEQRFNVVGQVQRVDGDGVAIKFIDYELEFIHHLMNAQPEQMKHSAMQSNKQDKVAERPSWFFYIVFSVLLGMLGGMLYFLFVFSR